MSFAPVLRRALRYDVVLAILIAVVGSVIGLLVAGVPGLISALIGAIVTVLFMALTAVSIIVGGRSSGNDMLSPIFLGIVLGVWLIKFILFIVIVVLLRGADFIDPRVMFVSILVAVIGSLVVDVVAFMRSRVPYVDVTLPGENPPAEG